MRALALTLALSGAALAQPCVLHVERHPDTLYPPTFTFTFALVGPCRGVTSEVSMHSWIGGDYPREPIALSEFNRMGRLDGNLPWWEPYKKTPYGPQQLLFTTSDVFLPGGP